MTDAVALGLLHAARVGHLATVDDRGRPSVVPFCYALIGEGDEVRVVSVLDEKPKSVADDELARVRHIRAHPDVAFVVDRYDEDWSRLAWVQVKGRARVIAPGDAGHAAAIAALRAKYNQYRAMAIETRPVIVIERLRVTSWRADDGRVTP